MRFSVVVPAHNEALLLPYGLGAIVEAARSRDVERIVVANRCTDSTVEVARAADARIVESDARNISIVRNAGAAAATGDVILTLDADCVMAPNTFDAIERALATGRYVGGATKVELEPSSLGRRSGRKFTVLRDAPIVASARKFDRYGDWHMFAMALQLREIRAAMKGTDTAWVDRYFFDFND